MVCQVCVLGDAVHCEQAGWAACAQTERERERERDMLRFGVKGVSGSVLWFGHILLKQATVLVPTGRSVGVPGSALSIGSFFKPELLATLPASARGSASQHPLQERGGGHSGGRRVVSSHGVFQSIGERWVMFS